MMRIIITIKIIHDNDDDNQYDQNYSQLIFSIIKIIHDNNA